MEYDSEEEPQEAEPQVEEVDSEIEAFLMNSGLDLEDNSELEELMLSEFLEGREEEILIDVEQIVSSPTYTRPQEGADYVTPTDGQTIIIGSHIPDETQVYSTGQREGEKSGSLYKIHSSHG